MDYFPFCPPLEKLLPFLLVIGVIFLHGLLEALVSFHVHFLDFCELVLVELLFPLDCRLSPLGVLHVLKVVCHALVILQILLLLLPQILSLHFEGNLGFLLFIFPLLEFVVPLVTLFDLRPDFLIPSLKNLLLGLLLLVDILLLCQALGSLIFLLLIFGQGKLLHLPILFLVPFTDFLHPLFFKFFILLLLHLKPLLNSLLLFEGLSSLLNSARLLLFHPLGLILLQLLLFVLEYLILLLGELLELKFAIPLLLSSLVLLAVLILQCLGFILKTLSCSHVTRLLDVDLILDFCSFVIVEVVTLTELFLLL